MPNSARDQVPSKERFAELVMELEAAAELYGRSQGASAAYDLNKAREAVMAAYSANEPSALHSAAANVLEKAQAHPLLGDYVGVHREHIGRLREALNSSTQPPAPEWQPIETAPRDGRYILAYVDDPRWHYGRRIVTKWISPVMGWSIPGISGIDPAAWMPLPAEPCSIPTKVVRCNCAGIPPTMPTFRTEHLPTCPCSGLGEEVCRAKE